MYQSSHAEENRRTYCTEGIRISDSWRKCAQELLNRENFTGRDVLPKNPVNPSRLLSYN